jgi:hypothetical protein
MPPKPSFRVHILSNAQEKMPPPPPTMMTFELPLENMPQPNAQPKPAFTVKKSRLTD